MKLVYVRFRLVLGTGHDNCFYENSKTYNFQISLGAFAASELDVVFSAYQPR
jgi:hypothetical protein